MNKLISIIALILLPVILLAGCKTDVTPETPVPPLNGGQEAQMIELSIEDFSHRNHITRDIELIRPGSLIVSLGANPTTGFQWSNAEISNTDTVTEQSFVYVPPQTEGTAVGTPGKNVWVFDSQQPGISTIKLGYSRPWEGGEKDIFTLIINIDVK